MKPEITCLVRAADMLGEVPLWCDRTRKLWWVDVMRPALQSYDPATGEHTAQFLGNGLQLGAIALREQGGFLLATNHGFYLFDPEQGGVLELIGNPEADKPGNRMNDGRCDRAGRFWVGSMHDIRREPLGTLYRLDVDTGCQAMLGNIVVPNALAWSPDDKTMYFADTHLLVIWAFDYDIDDGVISNQRVFKDWSHQAGRPDGTAVDAEGYLWNCMVGTGQLVRMAPDGCVDRVIQTPVRNPTCPAFGGDDLSTLFFTSHTLRMTPQDSVQEPLAGGLFALTPGVSGLPEPRFRG
ncbi:SMP-30/gluconolactonase/LRE family protein [Pseudomonas silvicola]|nr:SMP-30/gluconolactonase/LRE family protein [Pseudomonas silvicola]